MSPTDWSKIHPISLNGRSTRGTPSKSSRPTAWAAGPAPSPTELRCFMTRPGQGVNYAAGTWHHPLIALDTGGDFLVIDRGGPQAGEDCEERSLLEADVWVRG